MNVVCPSLLAHRIVVVNMDGQEIYPFIFFGHLLFRNISVSDSQVLGLILGSWSEKSGDGETEDCDSESSPVLGEYVGKCT